MTTVPAFPAVTIALPDGSTCLVQRRDQNRSLISRLVDGRCVWGQSFGCSPREDHEAQVAAIVADMKTRPADFCQWWFKDGLMEPEAVSA